jgi:hypothetical protein
MSGIAFLLFIFLYLYFKRQNWELFTEKQLVIRSVVGVGVEVVAVGVMGWIYIWLHCWDEYPACLSVCVTMSCFQIDSM